MVRVDDSVVAMASSVQSLASWMQTMSAADVLRNLERMAVEIRNAFMKDVPVPGGG